MSDRTIRTTRIITAAAREAALEVIRAVYLHEKGWLGPAAVEAEIDASFASEGLVSWFLVEAGRRPVGVLRLTDVFEDDPNSPLGFHTRVLGFTRIGTHRYGELACASRRIILVLDLLGAYRRLAAKKNRIFRSILADLAPSFEALTLPRVA